MLIKLALLPLNLVNKNWIDLIISHGKHEINTVLFSLPYLYKKRLLKKIKKTLAFFQSNCYNDNKLRKRSLPNNEICEKYCKQSLLFLL